MKKAIFVFSLLIVGFILFTGQKSDDPRWFRPETKVIVTEPNVPFFAVQRNIPINTVTNYLMSPFGIFSVGPNYRPYPTTATQSEIHGYANPNLAGKIMVGWNSYGPSFYGTGFGYSSNTGVNWTGSNTLPGLVANSGDPSVAITSNGTIFMNAIGSTSSQQVISWSTNGGANWAPYVIAGTNVPASSYADKNHLGIDDVPTSPYYNNLYVGWSDFGTSSSAPPIRIVTSTNLGVNWSAGIKVTGPISGYFSQGVNIHTGPNGEVYFVNATNQSGSPYTEKFIAFGVSTNGGANWTVNEQAFPVNGIRGNLKTTSIRVNSFPWMAVDKTGGPRNGWIYVTWAQKNLAPAGSDPDILFARSTNGGQNWSTPVRVNDDPMNNGRDQWFSNINVDAFGGINIVFYDSRNPSTNDSAEVYVARSIDGGNTFTNILVSDHRFKPKPISGLAGGYQGDYIGITSTNNKIFPLWCDDYSGSYQTWTGVIDIGPAIEHTPLGNTEQITGTRTVNSIVTPAGSGLVTGKTKLFYSKNSTTFTDSVVMTNSGGNNWTANITLTGAGIYRYYLYTIDSLSRIATSPAGAPGNYYEFTAATDTTKPVITHTPLQDQPKLTWPPSLSATVTDNIGVDSVWVKWYKNSTSTGIMRFNLAKGSGNSWSGTFNSDTSQVAIGDSIYYRVFARDAGSLHNQDSTQLIKFNIINQVTVCIGNGTTAVGWPFYTFYMDSRTDMLYLSSEINVPSAYVQKIGYNVASASSQAMNGFKIKMQNTTATTITAFTSTGWTTVYDGTYTIPGIGLQYIDLQTPFYYNGTNLLIEICFNNSSYTTNTTVYGTAITPQRNTHQHSDLSTTDGCVAITTPSTSYTTLPNVCLILNPGPMSVTNLNNEIPTTYALSQNYPNPFNPTTKINFALPKQGFVTMKIYDVLGREVRTLVNEVKTPGNYIVEFNANELASGVYFYKLEVNGFTDVKRMMLIK